MNKHIERYLDQKLEKAFESRLEKAFTKALQRYPQLQEILQSDVFYPNIPDATHSPSDDQPLMQLNNQKVFKQWAINHTGISETSNYGKHTRIDLKNFTESQDAADGFGLLYMLNNALVVKDSKNKIIPITGQGSIGSSGWAKIGAGSALLTIQWGNAGGGNNTPVNFFTPFSAIPTVLLTLVRGSGARSIWVIQNSVTTTKFNMGTDSRGTNFTWLAIGL